MNIILFKSEELNQPLPLEDHRSEHIIKILKLSPGDEIKAGLINGPSGRAKITCVDNNGITFTFFPVTPPVPPYPLTLLVGLTRPPTMQRLLKDLTTMGVERIIFTGCDFTEKSYFSGHLWKEDQYLHFLTDGAQQAGVTNLPAIDKFYSLNKALMSIPETSIRMVLSLEKPSAPSTLPTLKDKSCLLAIGPERGWSEKEFALFHQYDFNFINLNRRILRTETACIAGTSLILEKMGFIRFQ